MKQIIAMVAGMMLAGGAMATEPRHVPSCDTPHVAEYMAKYGFACSDTPNGFSFWKDLPNEDPDGEEGAQ